MFLEQQMIS